VGATWFAFPTAIYSSKRILIAAKILKTSRWETIGLIVGIYSWSIENADRNGVLENVSTDMLADAIGYPQKKAGLLVKALKDTEFIEVLDDHSILIKDWYDIGGKLTDTREKEAEKKRKQRAAARVHPADTKQDVPGDVHRDIPADIPTDVPPTIQYSTVHNSILSDDNIQGGEAAITRAQGAALNSPSDGQEKSKVQRSPKHRYGEYQHVLLTDDELSKLNETFGETMTQKAITFLDEHIEMKGYKAKSHYLAIRKWVVDAVKEKERKDQRQPYRPATENKGTLYGRTIDEMGYDDPINKSMSFDVSYWATPEEKDNE
jgi:hypothetical protein